METEVHSLNTLFDQLGLQSSDKAIDAFIAKNGKLPKDVKLHEARFWTQSQANFIKQAINQDAGWAEVVDHLDVRLR